MIHVLFIIVAIAFFWAGYWAGDKDARYRENEMRVKNQLTYWDGVKYGRELEQACQPEKQQSSL